MKSGIAKVLSSFVSAINSASFTWILSTGSWSDAGVWFDTENWQDGA